MEAICSGANEMVNFQMIGVSSAKTVEVVYATCCSLIVLECHHVTLDAALVARARRELLERSDGGAAFRSGFLLGVDRDGQTHQGCLALAADVEAKLLADDRDRGRAFSLSFLKIAEGRPEPADEGPFFEGPHIDTHPALTGSVELLRLLVNLSECPRRFLYATTDRWQLAERGVPYGRSEFQTLRLPPDIGSRVVVLPGRTPATIHALRFFASVVPHVGLNDAREHFLLSYEALAESPARQR